MDAWGEGDVWREHQPRPLDAGPRPRPSLLNLFPSYGPLYEKRWVVGEVATAANSRISRLTRSGGNGKWDVDLDSPSRKVSCPNFHTNTLFYIYRTPCIEKVITKLHTWVFMAFMLEFLLEESQPPRKAEKYCVLSNGRIG